MTRGTKGTKRAAVSPVHTDTLAEAHLALGEGISSDVAAGIRVEYVREWEGDKKHHQADVPACDRKTHAFGTVCQSSSNTPPHTHTHGPAVRPPGLH